MFDVFCCCHVLLLVIWLGLNVIGLCLVVGWECGVVGNVVLEDCFLWLGCVCFVCKVCWAQWFCCECVFVSCLEPLFVFCYRRFVLVTICFVMLCLHIDVCSLF